MFFMKISTYSSAYLLNLTCLLSLFLLHIEILVFFLKIIIEGIVHVAIRTTAAPCYLYVIISTAFEDLQISS